MRFPRLLALTAAATLLTGCTDGAQETTANDVPDVITTTTTAPTSTASTTKAPATASPTASKTPSPTPTIRRTTARPVATTARPTPRATTAKPTPRPTASQPLATGTQQLIIQNYAFSPREFTIPRGTTVRATNRDLDPHTWTANSGLWDSGSLGFNDSYSYRFMTKGTFGFYCVPHPDSMIGKVTVT